MKTKLKVGDKIRVYGAMVDETNKWIGTSWAGEEAHIVSIPSQSLGLNTLVVEFVSPESFFPQKRCIVSAKQCRRLIKRERRRVWVPKEPNSAFSQDDIDYIYKKPAGYCLTDFSEFIEVRKK